MPLQCRHRLATCEHDVGVRLVHMHPCGAREPRPTGLLLLLLLLAATQEQRSCGLSCRLIGGGCLVRRSHRSGFAGGGRGLRGRTRGGAGGGCGGEDGRDIEAAGERDAGANAGQPVQVQLAGGGGGAAATVCAAAAPVHGLAVREGGKERTLGRTGRFVGGVFCRSHVGFCLRKGHKRWGSKQEFMVFSSKTVTGLEEQVAMGT